MNETSLATEELFRITLQGVTYTFRIVEALINGADRLGQSSDRNAMMGFLSSLQNQDQPTKGQVKIEEMLRRGKGLAQFNLREEDFQTFQAAANEAGLLYASVCLDQTHTPGQRVYTVFCAGDDAATINNIIEINNLNAVHDADFIQQDAQPVQSVEATAPEPISQAEKIHEKNVTFLNRYIKEQERAAAPINPISPEASDRKEAPSEITSGRLSNDPSQTTKYHRSGNSKRPSVKEKVESIRKQSGDAPLSLEDKRKIGLNYLDQLSDHSSLGR